MACDDAVKQMLGHLKVFEFRTNISNYHDNSAAQSMRDLCRVHQRLPTACKDDWLTRHRVDCALANVDTRTFSGDDLAAIDTASLQRAAPALLEALLSSRPFFERLHWQLAFKFQLFVEGPTWWS